MNKIWFFVEGNSEEFFVTNLIRRYFYDNIIQVNDLVRFIKSQSNEFSKHICYCENCGSVDKIPHRINELYYLIDKSQSNAVIIICDIEKLKCNANRREVISNILNEDIDKSKIRYVFFNPMIENHYWDCPEIIKKILAVNYKSIFKSNISSIKISDLISKNQNGLKYLFKNYNLKYRESTFAENFFSRIDYTKCNNVVFKRLVNILNFYI